MTDKQLIHLLERHTEARKKANSLYCQIMDELNERGLWPRRDVFSCLHDTEPDSWEMAIKELIGKGGGGST